MRFFETERSQRQIQDFYRRMGKGGEEEKDFISNQLVMGAGDQEFRFAHWKCEILQGALSPRQPNI